MGYRALLFCPDEKIARTVTQVLSELEFAVEACIEPFAAVKKLMAEHFDAVVVDCDNDQNAALLFKSARSSAINQASLAVAVVEGQPGVAKAFRIGANLVLTKPINVEQAKGTLRVARGLLRKGEAAKPAAPGAPVPTTPVPPKPAATAPARPATLSAANAAKPRPAAPPIPKPAATIAASPQLQTPVQTPIPAQVQPPVSPAAGPASSAMETAAIPSAKSAPTAPPSFAPASAVAAHASTSGAASAPAPAREPAVPVAAAAVPAEIKPSASVAKVADASPSSADSSDAKPADATTAGAPVPSFTFGGANLPEKSATAGSQKIFLAIAAVVFLVCAIYFGWTQLHEKLSAPAAVPNLASPAPSKVPAPVQPTQVQPSTTPASAPGAQTSLSQSQAPDITLSTTGSATDDSANDDADIPAPNSKASAKTSRHDGQPATAPEATAANAAPIILKNGATKSSVKPPAADAAAPSMVGLAAGGSDGNLSNLTAGNNAAKPILQTLTISQGVSQGLLLKKVQPAYPPNALRMRTEGTVKLLATVGKTGNVTEVKVVSGDSLLTQSAVDAVKQWKYKPYLLNDEPVEIQTEVTINFKLPH